MFHRILKSVTVLADRQKTSVLLIGLLAFFGCWLVAYFQGIPVPQVHDEFSYLLASDTFAQGRLTNPAHPVWTHFETMHVLQQPTYMSKYPPAQGAVMALGQVVFGHPIYGVWLGMALMCASICWMLQAWTTPRWAFLGGLFSILHPGFGVRYYWAQSYWGGAVAALGGALVWGGLRRILRRPNITDSLILSAGLAVLANSRPLEGALAVLPSAGVLLFFIFSNIKTVLFKPVLKKIVVPVVIAGGITLAAMGYYNWRVTGDWRVMPYKKYDAAYLAAPIFFWEKPRPDIFLRHHDMRIYSLTKLKTIYEPLISVNQPERTWRYLRSIFFSRGGFIPNPFFIIPMLCGFFWFLRKDRWVIFAYLNLFAFCAIFSFLLVILMQLHYLAPVVVFYYFILISGFRVFDLIEMPSLRKTVKAFIIIAAITMFSMPSPQPYPLFRWASVRAEFIQEMKKTGQKHLVFVRYGDMHSPDDEWVYNDAEIDHAPVVWARDMDKAQNRKAVDYFKDRKVWRLIAGTKRFDEDRPVFMPIDRSQI